MSNKYHTTIIPLMNSTLVQHGLTKLVHESRVHCYYEGCKYFDATFGRDRKSHGSNTQNGYGFVCRRGSMTEIAKLGCFMGSYKNLLCGD